PVFGGILRSAHALEIPFVFDNLDRGRAEVLTGTGPERQGIADAMHRSWIAFARDGNPQHAGLPEWPRYDIDRRATMRFDTGLEPPPPSCARTSGATSRCPPVSAPSWPSATATT